MKTLVKLGRSRQVAIPKKITDHLRLSVGDYLDVNIQGYQVVLTPKTVVDRDPELTGDLEVSFADVRAGRVSPAFSTGRELDRWLKKSGRAK